MKSFFNLREKSLSESKTEEADYPHMMYHPETGKAVEVKTPEEHDKYAKRGYTHEEPEADLDEAFGQYTPHAESTIAENAWEEIPMMKRQLKFIAYAAEEIAEYLDLGVDPEEWYQNKLAQVHFQMKTLYAYMEGDEDQDDMMDESAKYVSEELSVADGVGAWIDDFKKSDAPQFKGKSDKERRDMALAAYLSAKEKMKKD